MAQSSPELAAVVRRGLRIKKAGNKIVQTVGGREVHPINVRVGGFYRAPRRDELAALVDELKWGRDAALETVRWTTTLPFPDFSEDYEFVALRHPNEYPMNEGRVVSSKRLDIAQGEYPLHFEEFQVPHSNALQSRRRTAHAPPAPRRGVGGEGGNGAYFVGPLARWNLNADRAPALAQEAARATGLSFPNKNPFVGIVVRALEVVLAFDEALRIIDQYEPPAASATDFQPCAGIGQAITEAPRGILHNRYETDAGGMIRTASIIPPTSQNQLQMEADLLRIGPTLMNVPESDAALQAEKILRDYDPCISCATHFLKLKVERQ